jgi:hypothetical protein
VGRVGDGDGYGLIGVESAFKHERWRETWYGRAAPNTSKETQFSFHVHQVSASLCVVLSASRPFFLWGFKSSTKSTSLAIYHPHVFFRFLPSRLYLTLSLHFCLPFSHTVVFVFTPIIRVWTLCEVSPMYVLLFALLNV